VGGLAGSSPEERAVSEQRYDAVVVGSGQGGTPLAGQLASAGRKVALIEAVNVGGSCVNHGCTPTKTMIASARAAYVASRVGAFGVRCGPCATEMKAVLARKRRIVSEFRASTLARLEDQGVELVRGRAMFAGERRLAVALVDGGRAELEAERIILNTGARPATPPVEGLDRTPHLDSTSILELEDVPAHLVVLGGGYIAVEFAQMFRRLGSDVTILQRGGQLLSREDEDVARALEEVLREDGIELHLGASIRRVRRDAGGAIAVELESPKGDLVRGSHLLVATGRRPNTDPLALDRGGVDTDDRGYVEVNDALETTAEGVYAIGDITPGPAFTHRSFDDSRILAANLLGDGGASTRGRLVPYTIFTDPQVGRIGLSEREATARGIPYRVTRMPAGYTARAIEAGETRGLWKALIAPDSGQILGAAIVAFDGGEVMAMLQIAMLGKLPYPALRDGIFAHPTLAEGLNALFTL
jgi:pyruvate/2-oxoglutarate dehydrogenase complex dihydrolipoamide dehydrogenase (E3) component